MTRPLSEALLRVRIPQDLKDACEAAAEARRQTLSEYVREALQAQVSAPHKGGGRGAGGLDLESLLAAAGEQGVYEVVLRTQSRPQRSKRGGPGGR